MEDPGDTLEMNRSHEDTPGLRPNENWVPEWAAKVVWYQVFPERFCNGNPNNDPTLAEIKGAYPYDDSSPWQIHPWTSDWYELQPYERLNGRSIWFNILRRRYGGDLEGILEKLDYLQELGIGAIYLNPVFDAPSHHKYDGASYHHIDPNFGPDPRGDRRLMAQETPDDPATWVWTAADRMMLQLIGELHRRKMRVIFDGVFNHMGVNSWAFQDVLVRQRESRFKDWFKIRSWDDEGKKTKFAYKGWCGVRDLPEFRQDARGIVDGPKQYIYAATRRWMDPDGDGNPEDGIDGWRLDVAFCIAHPFWQEWREFVKSINPDAYLTAEVIDPPEVLQPYLRGDEFDAVMNYNFAFS
ncbi:MAG: alpha-amylase, partial [Calditrichaeota bacterium]